MEATELRLIFEFNPISFLSPHGDYQIKLDNPGSTPFAVCPMPIGVTHERHIAIKERASRVVQCVNALAGVHDPAEFVELAKLNDQAVRTWEKTMMELVGEDGTGSVREAIQKLKDERDMLQMQIETIHTLAKNEKWDFIRDMVNKYYGDGDGSKK